jgi:GH15 family glucan-1,4-alpha-glucosidase
MLSTTSSGGQRAAVYEKVGIVGRQVVLSNGNLLAGLDEFGTVHDFYYPYVGLENLTTARNLNHKIGVWVDGEFSWLDDGTWEIKIDFEAEALVSDVVATNDKLKIKLAFKDFIDYSSPSAAPVSRAKKARSEMPRTANSAAVWWNTAASTV